MPICKNCSNVFPTTIIIDNKLRNLCSRKYCLDCTPFGTHNTRRLINDTTGNTLMVNPKKPRKECKNCGKEVKRLADLYCNAECGIIFRKQCSISNWKAGIEPGYNKLGVLRPIIKQYIKDKYQNKCAICSWSEINLSTGTIPVEVHHIDGHWQNTLEENLILLCPNCHSLTPTHGIANKGNGKPYKRIPTNLGI